MSKRVLILGSTGLLGQALLRRGSDRNLKLFGVARRGAEIYADITSVADIERLMKAIEPEIVINAAALVDLNMCETDPGLAFLVNARSAGLLAEASAYIGSRFIHISTDHFFVGDGAKLHSETSRPTLVNEYARSKFAGEALAATAQNALIVRTNVVGFRGWKGQPTFAEWCIDSILGNREISLFEDAFSSPIDADSLADAVLDLATNENATGVLNVAGRGVVSKASFISSLASELGATLTRASPGSIKTLRTRRAESCGLDVSKCEALLGRALPTIDEVLKSIASIYQDDCNRAYGG